VKAGNPRSGHSSKEEERKILHQKKFDFRKQLTKGNKKGTENLESDQGKKGVGLGAGGAVNNWPEGGRLSIQGGEKSGQKDKINDGAPCTHDSIIRGGKGQ